jgi:hypothetical protein
VAPQARVLTQAELSALAMRQSQPPTEQGWPLQTLFTGAPLHVRVVRDGRRRTLRFNGHEVRIDAAAAPPAANGVVHRTHSVWLPPRSSEPSR